MTNNANRILLFEKPLFSWYNLTTPPERGIDFPTESCFAYIIDGENQDLTGLGFIAKKGTTILSLCGKTVGQILSKTKTGNLNTIIVHFDRDTLKKVFNNEKPKCWKELTHPLKKDTVQLGASALVKSYFLSLSSLFEHKNALNEDILSVKLKEVVLLLLQTQESSYLNSIARSLFSDKVFSFDEVIESNLYEPLDIKRLAGMTNNSLASFKRKFNKLYNNSPAKYIRQKKLEKSKKMLTYSHNSISEICFQCGFSNPSSFARMFKAEYNVSPSEYRLNLNEQ